jgi:hypothetical protein
MVQGGKARGKVRDAARCTEANTNRVRMKLAIRENPRFTLTDKYYGHF